MKTVLKLIVLVSSILTFLLAFICMFGVVYGIVGELDLGSLLPNIMWRNMIVFVTGCFLVMSSATGFTVLDNLNENDK